MLEIYDSDVSRYSDDMCVFVLNSNSQLLELYQTQQIQESTNPDDYIAWALEMGLNLILSNHIKTFIEEGRSFREIILTRAASDPHNVIRVAYIDPDRIEISTGKLQPVMVTYGIVQLPSFMGFDVSSDKTLFDLLGKENPS